LKFLRKISNVLCVMQKKIKATFFVKVIPKTSRSEIVGWEEDVLRVRLNAVPEKGKANKELIALLSKELKIPKRDITILQGETSRLKKIEVEGMDLRTLQKETGWA